MLGKTAEMLPTPWQIGLSASSRVTEQRVVDADALDRATVDGDQHRCRALAGDRRDQVLDPRWTPGVGRMVAGTGFEPVTFRL